MKWHQKEGQETSKRIKRIMMVKMPWHWDGINTDEKKRCLGAKRLCLHGVIVSKKKVPLSHRVSARRGQGPGTQGPGVPLDKDQRPETREGRSWFTETKAEKYWARHSYFMALTSEEVVYLCSEWC